MRKKIAALLLILSCLGSAEARKRRSHPDPERFSDTAEVYSRLESVPPFGIYKDNYFVTGSSFSGGKLTKNNSDAKFQISIRHRLIKGVLPFHNLPVPYLYAEVLLGYIQEIETFRREQL